MRDVRILVIGGRVTGTAAAVHLAERLPTGSRIVVVDPADDDYPSVFDDADPLLLANTSPQVMSLYPDRPDDFLNHAGWPAHAMAPPRHLVGAYCRARFDETRERVRPAGVDLHRVQDVVDSVRPGPDGYVASLRHGAPVTATDVVIAAGVAPASGAYVPGGMPAYPAARLRQWSERSGGGPALVLGLGLSALDAALVLASTGVLVTMTSRSGTLPAVRTRTLPGPPPRLPDTGPVDFRRLIDDDGRRRGHPPLALQLVEEKDPLLRLRKEISLAQDDLCAWQDSLVGAVDAVTVPPRRLVEDHDFLWRYGTALTLPNALRLLNHLQDGSIRLIDHVAVRTHDYSTVVCAMGVTPPRLHHRAGTLYLTNPPATAQPVKTLTPTLQLVLAPGRPERVWAVGPASGIAAPFANVMRVAVRQAQAVARHITTLIAGQPGERPSRVDHLAAIDRPAPSGT